MPPDAPSPTALSSALGEWFHCDDDVAHYFLAGRCLCSAAPVPLGPPAPADLRGRSALFAVDQCPECLELNTDRWAKGGAP